ncbi:GNAT family N-acetyltransferase [Fusibacter sp. JL216-2]|uniref:GNAT family N-acetyltransferase n=1 Tax=Fusibacter sp. JL216-2 TaxID=3071453 RepID=UPI003D32DDAF
MIFELNPSQFKSISHLLDGERVNLEVKAVVEGYNPGWVFVDNVMEPQAAMVWSKGIKGFYFLGKTDSESFNNYLNTYIKYIIAPRARKMELSTFEFSGTSQAWEDKLMEIFSERDLSITKQYVYKRPASMADGELSVQLDKAYEVHTVNKDLFERTELDLSLVKESVNDWWGSAQKFSENGIGYCIVHENTAVCSCTASSYDGSEVQSHIVTNESYRKKGLATAAVAEFVKTAEKTDLDLYWDCMEKNEGSRALAEKMGYVKAYEYKLFEFSI